MKILSTAIILLLTLWAQSQQSTPVVKVKPVQDSVSVVVHKDPRIDLLVKKQIQINEETTRESRKNTKGFRLLVINTNKRDEALAAKTKVYTYYPELKAYLIYQSPYFKVKVGNFKERKDAEEYQKKLQQYFPKGVFIMNDTIEVKPDKESEAL
ncbi:MAG: SPOR domain-containing protein [Chitinophagaceae bacterium]|nr:MAG: SPOR domain-containing protein [Chitinophagaceae bacterium]